MTYAEDDDGCMCINIQAVSKVIGYVLSLGGILLRKKIPMRLWAPRVWGIVRDIFVNRVREIWVAVRISLGIPPTRSIPRS